MKNLFFVYNPYAGKGLFHEKVGRIVEIFTNAGYEVTLRPTLRKDEAISLAENMEDRFEVVVVGGGDGTLDELITGLLRRERSMRPLIGIIPTGSTNDFGSSLMLPKNVIKAAENVTGGEIFHCDIGRFNESHVFVYVAAFGLFTDIPYTTPQRKKNMLGYAAYFLEGTKELSEIKTYKMKIIWDNGEMEDDFLDGMVTNSKSIGGFRNFTNKHAEVAFDDGLLEVTLIRTPKNPRELQSIIDGLLFENIVSDHIVTFKTRKVRFECEEEVAWTMDGENGGKHMTADIFVDEKAVDIIVPQKALSEISINNRMT